MDYRPRTPRGDEEASQNGSRDVQEWESTARIGDVGLGHSHHYTT